MRTFVRLTIIVALLTFSLAASVGPAQAAVQAGNQCTANTNYPNNTVVQLARDPGAPLPIAAPVDGVVTSWQMTASLGPTTVFAESIKVMRPTPSPIAFEVTAESSFGEVRNGTSTFSTRLPVRSGDRFGLYGIEGALTCASTGTTADKMGFEAGNVTAGSPFSSAAEHTKELSPVSVNIEPDADHDGYGDETQDKCPQSAAYQGPCPTISLDSFSIVLKRSVLVLVSASESSWVQVFGQVGWRPRHKGGALASKTPKPAGQVNKGAIVGLSGGTTLVKPGEVTPYNVKLPKSVLRHLSQIAPKQVVKGTITAQTTDLAGQTVEHTITIRLHGRSRVHSAGTS